VTGRRDIDQIQEELDELFADLWQVPRFAGLRRGFRPNVDCYRTENPAAVTVVVELAGIDPNSKVEITVAERTLTISGARRRPLSECRVSYRQMEIDYGSFQRRLALAEPVDPERAKASYENGLLTIVLPLAQKPRTGRVFIALGEAK
jgi:HSP20 family protein